MKKGLHSTFNACRPYLAEIGESGFIATTTILAIGVTVDHLRPGTFFSYLAPQYLATALVVFMVLAVLRKSPAPRGFLTHIRFATIGIVLAIGAYVASTRYFASFGVVGNRLALAAVFAVALPFFVFYDFGTDDEERA